MLTKVSYVSNQTLLMRSCLILKLKQIIKLIFDSHDEYSK